MCSFRRANICAIRCSVFDVVWLFNCSNQVLICVQTQIIETNACRYCYVHALHDLLCVFMWILIRTDVIIWMLLNPDVLAMFTCSTYWIRLHWEETHWAFNMRVCPTLQVRIFKCLIAYLLIVEQTYHMKFNDTTVWLSKSSHVKIWMFAVAMFCSINNAAFIKTATLR